MLCSSKGLTGDPQLILTVILAGSHAQLCSISPGESLWALSRIRSYRRSLASPVTNEEAARHLSKRHGDILILMVTTDPSQELQREARRAGIKGVCLKSDMQCLVKAVETVMNGGAYFSEGAAA